MTAELPESVRRRLEQVFGEVLPDTTGDERDDGGERADAEAAGERELLADRPPHHDPER